MQKMQNNIHVSCQQIARSFTTEIKDQIGWLGLWQLFAKRQTKVHTALQNITFEIAEGSFVGLIGANGAGKTTLLKILSGLIPPSQGSAKVLGEDPFARSVEFRKSIALVMGQKAQLWWDLPAIDAFELNRALYQIPPKVYKERVSFLTDLLDVKRLLHTQIRKLSLGERMKMELIGALLHWPKIIFLDEPTIGLDMISAQKMRDFLMQFNSQQKATLLLTSHNMDDIEQLCSRILIMQNGTLVYDGSPKGLVQDTAKTLTFSIHPALTITEFQRNLPLGFHKLQSMLPGTFQIDLQQQELIPFLQALLQSKVTVQHFEYANASLETTIAQIFTSKKLL